MFQMTHQMLPQLSSAGGHYLLLPFEEAPTGTPNPEKVDAGLLGLAFFLVLITAVILLVMSMRKHLQRVDVTKHQQDKLARAAAAARAQQAVPPPPSPADAPQGGTPQSGTAPPAAAPAAGTVKKKGPKRKGG